MASHRKLLRSPSPYHPSPSHSPHPTSNFDRAHPDHPPMALRVQPSPHHHPQNSYSSHPHPPHHPPPHHHGHVAHYQYPPPVHHSSSHDMDMDIPSHSHSHAHSSSEHAVHHQSHSYQQSEMSHPYPSAYPLLPAPNVPPRNGGLGTGAGPSRKRKKADSPDDSQQQPPARRLRRLHEACTRCRTKKIKCDSKLPSCSACTAANVECNQEDRHRQTLKPRGYTDKLEVSLVKCVLVLQRLVPGFEESPDVDGLAERHNCSLNDIDVNAVIAGVLAAASGSGGGGAPGALAGLTPMKQEPPSNPLSISVNGGPGPMSDAHRGEGISVQPKPPPMREAEHESQSQSPTVPAQPPPTDPRAAPSTSAATGAVPGSPSKSPTQEASNDVKGQDPQSNDLSGLPGLIKAFGVSRHIVRDLPKPDNNEAEDVLGGVRLEDDPLVPMYPKLVSQWTARPLPRRSTVPSPPIGLAAHTLGPHPTTSPASSSMPPSHGMSLQQNPRKLAFRLPRDRRLTERVVKKYFDSLNIHRPVFIPEEFEVGLRILYESLDGSRYATTSPVMPTNANPSMSPTASTGTPSTTWGPGMNPPASVPPHPQDDPGFLCSVYLILALGRLSEDNDHMAAGKPGVPEILRDYPTHEEFFELALAVKPDLRVTISSLQALILLQWYLYTERHGRTLWRLVGNLVRLSIELGLHHDPSEQGPTFTPAECEVRNRLWWTVMIHDRGTSVILGRPLAIADADFNTPFPRRHSPHFSHNVTSGFSEHFEHSPHLTSIQGDIINALYRPGNHKQTADQVIRHASRITKGLGAFSRGILGERYRPFFEGTEGWTNEQRIALVSGMTEDQGLTLLKYGIARILLLRALFTSSIIGPDARRRALRDAVITSHNILTIQMQLTSFPSVAFFVAPSPIHIAAMVIIYGIISKCDALPYARAREDVCSALHIVPLFRWRWNRKDAHGSHPLIVSLAKKVFGSDVLSVAGPLGPPILIPEWDWTTGMMGDSAPGLMSPARDGLSMSSHAHQHQSMVNGGGSSGMYHQDGTHTSPVSATTNGPWDPQAQQQMVTHGGHSRQHSGMISNGTNPATSPQQQHAHPQQHPHSPHDTFAPHPHNNGIMGPHGSSSHDSSSSSSSQQPPHLTQAHYSPVSDSTPPSYQINDSDKNWVAALLYPPPLTTEQQMPTMSAIVAQNPPIMDQNGMVPHGGSHLGMASGPQAQVSNGGAHIQAYGDMTAPPGPPPLQLHHQPPPHHIPSQHAAHQHHAQMHGHHPQSMYGGAMSSLPAHQSTTLADYGQSAAYYLQEEFDQSVPMDVAIPPHNGMWTS